MKIPFTTNIGELKRSVRSVDTRSGGWGIFYSGLLVLSFLYFIFRIIKGEKFDMKSTLYVVFILMTFVPAFFVNGLNNVRYWPYPFLFPAWLLLALFGDNRIKTGVVMSAFILLNIAPSMGGNAFYLYKTITQKGNYQVIADYLETASSAEEKVVYGRRGLIYNLHDRDIKPTKIIPVSDAEAQEKQKAVDLLRGSIFLP